MKTYHKILLAMVLTIIGANAFSQGSNDAGSLVKQGIQLHDQGKYEEAIDKYKQALKLDSNDLQADYELAFTLYMSGRSKEAIPYLETILKSNSSRYESYELLGSIYDDSKKPEKAIECYKAGIAEKPDYGRLHFNLGITYLGVKKYAEAEACAIDAIKLDPKHPGSQRLYALAAIGQNKRANSLLAWCAFLMLEPESKRSVEALAYVKYILNFGISKTDDKHVNINIPTKDAGSPSFVMTLAVVAATTDKKNLTPVDSLSLQLESVFKVANMISSNKDDLFYTNFYAKYFKDLAQNGYTPAFARYISLTAYKDENLAWFKENEKQYTDLIAWVDKTQRGF